ncbi:MAG: GcrA family cell cycle regulator [Candidatus Halichondribacter symbioticus]
MADKKTSKPAPKAKAKAKAAPKAEPKKVAVKAEPKKAAVKKAVAKKAVAKKVEPKKAVAKKPEPKKVEAKKVEAKKPEPKKTVAKKPATKRAPAKKTGPTFEWNDTRIRQLKKMWADGESAGEIAATLGGLSRNAIIGKIYRLGLSNRDPVPAVKMDKPKGKKQPKVASTTALPSGQNKLPLRRPPVVRAGQPLPPQPAANEISEDVLRTAAETLKKAKKISLMELTEKTCKWPVGDPSTDDFWFCGLDSETGKPYCKAHNDVAFHPPNMQRKMRVKV